jgi:hypothetical protein
MNSRKGFRRAKGDFLRAAAGAAALVVTTMCAALWAGPAMAAGDSGAPSASSTQPATAGASVSLASLALTVGGVLVAVMVVVLTVDYGRRRIARRRTGGRRGGTHAKASGPRADGAIKSVTDPFPLDRPADVGGYGSSGDPGLGLNGMAAAHPELALPVRVRRDFAPRTEDQGPGQPDAPRAHEHLRKP